MTWELAFWVPGDPQAAGRPRATMRGAFRAGVHRSDADLSWRSRVTLYGSRACPLWWAQVSDPIDAELVFHFRVAKSSRFGLWKATKPDLDNVAKSTMDALNTIAWADDKAVARLTASKQFSDTPGCLVRIRRMPERVDQFIPVLDSDQLAGRSVHTSPEHGRPL